MLILPRRKAGVAVEDVFATSVWTAPGGTLRIVNGIDNLGKGGLVWEKIRNNASAPHRFVDTARGGTNFIESNNTNAEATNISIVPEFHEDGFTSSNFTSGNLGVAWNFRQARKFFDIVTYTGDGTSGRAIAHDLGSTPGMVVIKRLDTTSQWTVRHTSATGELVLNTDAAQTASHGRITAASDTTFTVNSDAAVNASGGTYVAYIFGHDTSDTGIIQCGSYTGNGSATGPVIDLGWEPQYLILKRASGGIGQWYLIDTERTPDFSGNDAYLLASVTNAETTSVEFVATVTDGFQIVSSNAQFNFSGATYAYLAIRAEGA